MKNSMRGKRSQIDYIERKNPYSPWRILLPDGKVKEGKKCHSTPFDVAKEISKCFSPNALIAKVDGVLCDMHRPLEGDCKLELFTFDSEEGRDTFWYSSATFLPVTGGYLWM